MSIMAIVSPEALMPQCGGRWTRDNVAAAWASAHRTLRTALADPAIDTVAVMIGPPGSGKSTYAATIDRPGLVIFDAVFAKATRRVAIAKRIRASGKSAVAVWVRTPLQVALARNAARPAWRRVPISFIRSAAVALAASPPSRHEGWNAVRVIDGTAHIARIGP